MKPTINKSSANRYKYWSSREISLLKKLYPKMWVKDLTKIFPGRTKDTITAKALSLGLPSAKLWQTKENNILHRYFVDTSKNKLLRLLPKRSWKAILAQGERSGFKRKTNKPKLKVNEFYFKKWSPNMAYLLGFILADGSIVKGAYKGYSDALKFGVHQQDIDILKKVKQELEAEHAISFVKEAVHLCIASQRIVDDLKDLGISYRKSFQEKSNKKIPNVPQRYTRDFIRGIVDGDGSINFNKKGRPQFNVCGEKKIITFIQNHFLSKFNIYSKITHAKKNGKQYNLFYIAYGYNSAKTLINYLYNNANLYLKRKSKLAKQCSMIEIKPRNNYTEKEKQIIKQFYPIWPKDKILLMLKNRSWPNIQCQASKLCVYKYNIKNKE